MQTFPILTPLFVKFISCANEFKKMAKSVGESFCPCFTPICVFVVNSDGALSILVNLPYYI